MTIEEIKEELADLKHRPHEDFDVQRLVADWLGQILDSRGIPRLFKLWQAAWFLKRLELDHKECCGVEIDL